MNRQIFGRRDNTTPLEHGDTREAILERLLKGEITPDGARTAAERLEIGSLTDPDPRSFDPMAEAHWTIPMALAWIASRNVEQVLILMDEYRAACFEFVPIHGGGGNGSGWYKRHARPRRGTIEQAARILGRVACEAAQVALRAALTANGRAPLAATATPSIGGAHSNLPSIIWTELEWCDHKGGVYTRKKDSPFRYVHMNVLMSRDEILARWPELPGKTRPAKEPAGQTLTATKLPAATHAKKTRTKKTPAARKPRTPKRDEAQAAAETVLVHWMSRNPQTTPFAKAKWEAGAMAKWPGLSRAAFGRAWTAAVKKTGAVAWNKSGAVNAPRRAKSDAVPLEYFDT